MTLTGESLCRKREEREWSRADLARNLRAAAPLNRLDADETERLTLAIADPARVDLTAYHTPGAHPAQRLGDAVQAAQGYALLDEKTTARRLLAEAEALTDEAARELPPGTAYWLTPDFQHLNIGLALLGMDEHAAAAFAEASQGLR